MDSKNQIQNREIRFRLYSHKTKCMYADSGLTSLGINDAIQQAEEQGYIIMQYTGLKDKNGVEIYEGDHFGNPQFPVYFVDGMFCIGGVPLSDYVQGAAMEKIEEVKGNIYQNSELLK